MRKRILATACALMLGAVPPVHADTTLPLTFGDEAGFCVLTVFMEVMARIHERTGSCVGAYAVDVDIDDEGDGTAALDALPFYITRIGRGSPRGMNWSVVSTNSSPVTLGGLQVASVTGTCASDAFEFITTGRSEITEPTFVPGISVVSSSTFNGHWDESVLSWGTPDDIARPALVRKGLDVLSRGAPPSVIFPRGLWRETTKFRRSDVLPGLITMRRVRLHPNPDIVGDCRMVLRNGEVDNVDGTFQISPEDGVVIRFR